LRSKCNITNFFAICRHVTTLFCREREKMGGEMPRGACGRRGGGLLPVSAARQKLQRVVARRLALSGEPRSPRRRAIAEWP